MNPRRGPIHNLRALARRFFVFTAVAAWAGGGQARQVTVTVLNTTDMHGSIQRTPGVYADHNEGSLLQCASIIRSVREATPNTLLVDCGDMFQGTAESYLTQGGVMAKAMNALDYDAFAIGNHEFDWGVEMLAEMLGKMEATPLAANLVAAEHAPAAFRKVLPFTVREMDGLKVAIVGLTSPNIPNWFREVGDKGLTFTDSRRALEQTLPLVRKERPHLMILLVHQGLQVKDDEANQINAIGRRFSEFDLVLGGHLHWVLAGARIWKVDYAQAGSGAGGVMRTDLVFDTVENKVVDKRFEFLPVLRDTPEDSGIAEQVAGDLRKADEWLQTVIGKAEEKLTVSVAGAGLCPVQQLLCEAIARKTEAAVVLHGVLSGESIEAGPIRVADIWRIVPYENTVGTLYLNAREIRGIMEEAAAYVGTERYFGAWGLQYELHPNAPEGRRIRNLRLADGSPIHYKTRLKVALNSYHLAGGGGRFPTLVKAANTPNTRLELLKTTTRDMVMDYVRAHPSLKVEEGTNAVVVREESHRDQRAE